MEERKELPSWAKGLNERQVEAMLYVGERGRITNREYQELGMVSHETARRDLSNLAERGLVSRRGAGRGTHYVLAD